MPNLSKLAHDRGAGLQPAGPIWGSPDKRFGPARVTRDLFLPPGCGRRGRARPEAEPPAVKSHIGPPPHSNAGANADTQRLAQSALGGL